MESNATHDLTPSGDVKCQGEGVNVKVIHQPDSLMASNVVVISDTASSSRNRALSYLKKHIPVIKPRHRTSIEYDLTKLIDEADPLVFFKQKNNQQMCALYAVWNYLGRNDIITLVDCQTQIDLMHYQYLNDRVDRLTKFICLNPTKNRTEKSMSTFMKTQSLGTYTGGFSMNVMSECLRSLTNIQYKRLNTKRQTDYIELDHLEKLIANFQYKGGVILLITYMIFRVEQHHVVTIKNDLIYDCNEKSTIVFKFLEWKFHKYVTNVYNLQTRPSGPAGGRK